MDHLVNLSRAAKLAGVSRRQIQARIQDGDLEAFEGEVRLSALAKVYPEVDAEADAMVERMARIQNNALFKPSPDEITDERFLADQVHRLQLELADAYAEIDAYQHLVVDLRDRLVAMKEGCERKEKQVLQALVSWMNGQMKQHQSF